MAADAGGALNVQCAIRRHLLPLGDRALRDAERDSQLGSPAPFPIQPCRELIHDPDFSRANN